MNRPLITRAAIALSASAVLLSGLLAAPASAAVVDHTYPSYRSCGPVHQTKEGPKAPCLQVKGGMARIGTKLPKRGGTINWRPWLPNTGKVKGGAEARDGFRGKYKGVRYGKPHVKGFVKAVQFKKRGKHIVNRPGWIDRPGNRFVPLGGWRLGLLVACGGGVKGNRAGVPAGFYEGGPGDGKCHPRGKG